jgi:hypothetical protein
MRVVAASLALALSVSTVLAQGVTVRPAPDAATPEKPKVLPGGKSVVDEAVPECMRLWDPGTHMSKQEWARTCRRIQSRLENLKVENVDINGPGMRKKGPAGKEGSVTTPRRTN